MATLNVEFDGAGYSLECLNAAAYRLIGTASCQIETVGQTYICRLTPSAPDADGNAIRLRFIDLVTDESLRERIAVKTEPLRNVILALAFGALASEPPQQS